MTDEGSVDVKRKCTVQIEEEFIYVYELEKKRTYLTNKSEFLPNNKSAKDIHKQ